MMVDGKHKERPTKGASLEYASEDGKHVNEEPSLIHISSVTSIKPFDGPEKARPDSDAFKDSKEPAVSNAGERRSEVK